MFGGLLIAGHSAEAREIVIDGDILYSFVNDNGTQNDLLNQPVTMHVDGRFIASDVTPTIRNSRTLVPLRATGEALNAELTLPMFAIKNVLITNNQKRLFNITDQMIKEARDYKQIADIFMGFVDKGNSKKLGFVDNDGLKPGMVNYI